MSRSRILAPGWLCPIPVALLLACAGCGRGEPETSGSPSLQDASGESGTQTRELKRLGPGVYKQSWVTPDSREIDFVISVPDEVYSDQKVPLVLVLHFGADRFPRFFGGQTLGGMVLPALEGMSAIAVAPDVINKTWTNPQCEESVMALMEEVCQVYPVDTRRILVTGYSLGGRGTWHFAGRYPEFFTAAIPVAGRPPADYAETRWTVPMLCIQSPDDEVFPIKYTRDAVNELQERDLTVQMYEVEGISHYDSARFVEPLKTAMGRVRQIWDARASNASPGQPAAGKTGSPDD